MFDHDRCLDLAIVPRNLPLSLISTIPRDMPASPFNVPDEYAVLGCAEYTVPARKGRFRHNQDYVYSKMNEMLKCPLNLFFLVLQVGIHGENTVIWYGDRNGIIKVDLGTNGTLIFAALSGLANLPFKRDPCVDIYHLQPTRAYKITLSQGIYYGLYGKDNSVLYVADGINSRGTLVLAGMRESPLIETNHVTAFDATTETDRVAIKFSHPSIPWNVNLSTDGSIHSSDWSLEWQALEILRRCNVPHTPRLVAHDVHLITTRQVREAAGLRSDRYRVRTILVTQPLADTTLQKIINKGLQIGLPELVSVLRDIVKGM